MKKNHHKKHRKQKNIKYLIDLKKKKKILADQPKNAILVNQEGEY